jgi:RNA recognition motif-containing protein
MKDNEKGDNKGFAFITYKNKEEAEKSINTLNGHELKVSYLKYVKFSLCKSSFRFKNILE